MKQDTTLKCLYDLLKCAGRQFNFEVGEVVRLRAMSGKQVERVRSAARRSVEVRGQ
jgi:hypothetical protein